MLLVFWVLWRLRWLNARETFAAVRWPIPGAVPSSAAVMAFYLRSFEANKLNTKTQRLRGAGFCTMRGTSSVHLGHLYCVLRCVAAKRQETRELQH